MYFKKSYDFIYFKNMKLKETKNFNSKQLVLGDNEDKPTLKMLNKSLKRNKS